VVSLSNVGDDRLGEDASVVWEREPGAVVMEAATLPEVFPGAYDSPARMAAFLDAVRWGAVTSADSASMQAPFRSGVRIEDYQLDPVVRALRAPRANLLLADDVGLGKSIEAGLTIQELILRQRARRIIIVVPADLTVKWQREMADKFGLDFHIVDSAAVKALRRTHGPHANPWRIWPRTIVSLAWLRGERGTRAMDDFLPSEPGLPRAFDVLIVDEAHHLAPAGKGQYAVDSQQTRAIARLAPHCENRLFLTATPHNGYRNSFAALLELLDPQRFARGTEPNQNALADVMIRRTKDDAIFVDEQGRRRFAQRLPIAVPVRFTEAEREIHALLERYAEARRSTVKRKSAGAAADMVTLLLKKRLFSSPAAFTATLGVHAHTMQEAGTSENGTWDDIPEWLEDARDAAADAFLLDDERDAAADDLLAKAARVTGSDPQEADRVLSDMLTWAERYGQAPDAKVKALIDWLTGTLIDPDTGVWREDRVVIFTEYRATQRWMKDLLDSAGLGGEHLALIYGGQDDNERQRIKDAFQASPDRDPIRILLATDSASEGIDLQKHCWRLVNYDIPFNPNRLDQRIGRVDRYGQTHDVEIRHFIGEGWQDTEPGSYERDLEFLSRVATKIASIREDLGKVNRLMSDAVEAHMTGDGSASHRVDTVTATPTRDLLKFELQTRERVAAAQAELQASIENLRVGPGNIERVVATALALANQPPLGPGPEPGTWTVGKRHGVWERATRNLPDPLDPDIVRPVTFDPDVAAALDDRVVLAHLGHPLVADSTRLLRARVWGTGTSDLHRVAVCTVPADTTNGRLAVAAFSRLVIVGGDGNRLHEEVFAAGGTFDEQNRWERLTVGRLEGILNEALDADTPVTDTSAADAIAADWDRVKGLLRTAYEARARERYDTLSRKLMEKRDADIARRTEQLLHLQAQIEEALRGPKPEQLDMFQQMQQDEKDQYRADRASWDARLQQIPKEIAEEAVRLNRRYEDLTSLVFPAAVVIALPDTARTRAGAA
jgi:superfamily II DNA or RNA helicase